MTGEIQRIAVLGAGTMGHGIAHVAAASGYDCSLFALNEEALDKGLAQVQATLEKGIARGKVTKEEMEAAKDYEGKQKETKLESGRVRSEFFLTKKKRKPH